MPRADGLVVGATQYEAGHDIDVTVAGVRDLIADAETLMPGIGEYALAESKAGSRSVPDNLPLIGRLADRVVVATGHGRNGILHPADRGGGGRDPRRRDARGRRSRFTASFPQRR